ncbi:MAG: hypothetical protein ACLSVD_07025 [Eggerthellaceae bacterium]
MIQNPNEIAARQRMEEAMSRIEANVRAPADEPSPVHLRQCRYHGAGHARPGRMLAEGRRERQRGALRLTRRARTRPAPRAATAPST